MTRTHVFAVAVVAAWSVTASAQVPAPPSLPATPLPPAPPVAVQSSDPVERGRLSLDRDRISAERARLNAERGRANAERARASAEQDRAAAERDRAAAEWDRLIGAPQLDWRLGDLDLQLQNLHIPDFDFNFDFDLPDFDFPEFEHLNNLHIDIPDVHVDLDAINLQLDAVRNTDFAGIAHDARERAAMALAQVPAVPPVPPVPPSPPAVPYVFADSRSPEGLYDQARGYIDRDQYERAVDVLNRLIALKGTRTDAAMYWKAYSLSKLARNPEALTTLQELRKQFGNSSWIRDAGFLEIEVRQASGQAVNADAQVSEDMKLLALQGIMRSDPDTAIPVVEKTLAGNSSVRVK